MSDAGLAVLHLQGCKPAEDFEPFLLGAATRQPQEDDDEEPQ